LPKWLANSVLQENEHWSQAQGKVTAASSVLRFVPLTKRKAEDCVLAFVLSVCLLWLIGIGREIALRMAVEGANVFGISRTQSDLDELKKV
jgi:hypothetical protein